ncbi:hypothetical protein CF319_g7692 [Tilletia indica]|nr:hypothetical protein CF319_g7692 [Tilletia indica]
MYVLSRRIEAIPIRLLTYIVPSLFRPRYRDPPLPLGGTGRVPPGQAHSWIIKEHSEFIANPIQLVTTKEVENQVEDDKEVTDESDDKNAQGRARARKVKELPPEQKELDNTKPIRIRDPKKSNEEEYDAFYKPLTND